MRRLRVWIALVLVLALVGAACDDDDDNGNGNGGPEPTGEEQEGEGTELSGEPVKIGVMAPVESQTLQFPDTPRAARVAEMAVNDRGGIDGRPVEVVFCDDKDDPNAAAACADRLIRDEGVTILVGGIGRQTSALYPVMTAEGVPMFSSVPVTAEDFSSELSFPSGGGVAGFINFPLITEDGWSKAAVIHTDTPSGQAVFSFAQQGYTAGGVEEVESIAIDPATVDFQPVIARLRQAEPDAFTVALAPSQAITAVETALDLGVDVPIVVYSGSIDQRFIDAAADAGADLRIVLTYAKDPSLPRVEQYNEEMEQYGSEVEIVDTFSDATVAAWLGVTLFAEIANEELDEVSAEAFVAYLGANPLETGMTGTLDFTQPGPLENFPRLVNVFSYPGILEGGEVVQTETEAQTAVEGASDQ